MLLLISLQFAKGIPVKLLRRALAGNRSSTMAIAADGLAFLRNFIEVGHSREIGRVLKLLTPNMVELDDVDISLATVEALPTEVVECADFVLAFAVALALVDVVLVLIIEGSVAMLLSRNNFFLICVVVFDLPLALFVAFFIRTFVSAVVLAAVCEVYFAFLC